MDIEQIIKLGCNALIDAMGQIEGAEGERLKDVSFDFAAKGQDYKITVARVEPNERAK